MRIVGLLHVNFMGFKSKGYALCHMWSLSSLHDLSQRFTL